jgi:alkanesulfonate monooxygenase SsuD/methylene tetrahydromethanopterin reductase-like flavin-dependent oxidoreductase (luciferase family)
MKFGLLFSHQVPPGSDLRPHETYSDMLACLPRAEDLGYESCFMVSHHAQKDGLCPGPLIACAGAASVTRRMRIGTGVLLVPLYAPLKLAEDVAVLDNLSGGRFVFGVAPGYVAAEFAAHGIPRDERVGRFEEALDLMTLAWTSETFSFAGKYYQVPETRLTPKPVQRPHPPLWYGVSATSSLKRAARRHAIQIMSPRHGPEELLAHFKPYEEEAARIGWTIPERPIIRAVFVAPTKAEAEAIAAPALNYLFTELYGAASAAGDRVLRAADGSVITDKNTVGFDNFKNRYIIGDPDFAVAELSRYRDAVRPTEVVCWMHLPGIKGADALRSVELFAREVMPQFAGR